MTVASAAADLALWVSLLLIVLALIVGGPVLRLRRQRRYDALRLAGYRGMWPPPPGWPKYTYPPIPPREVPISEVHSTFLIDGKPVKVESGWHDEATPEELGLEMAAPDPEPAPR